MSAPQLLYGARGAADFAMPAALAPVVPDTIRLHDVEIHYALFELPMAAVLPRLPASLHPSIPAVLATCLWRVPDSACGPFSFAYTGIACRTGIKPRHFVVRAWCDNPDAGLLFGDRYGLQCDSAAIVSRESYDRIHGVVRIDERTILEVVTTDMVALAGTGAMVKYSPALGLASLHQEPKMIQFEAAYDFKRVLRGEVRAAVYDAAAMGEPALEPTTPIAGTFAVCDVDLLPARFCVDLNVPAESGGAKKIKSL